MIKMALGALAIAIVLLSGCAMRDGAGDATDPGEQPQQTGQDNAAAPDKPPVTPEEGGSRDPAEPDEPAEPIEPDDPAVPARPDTERPEVREAVDRLSLDEKIGQLFFVGISGQTVSDETLELIRARKVGGVILYGDNLHDPVQAAALLNALKEANAGNPLPLFLGVDQEGGRVTRLPGDLAPIPSSRKIGASGDPEYAYEIGQLLGMEVGAFGFNLDFAPVLDVNSNPDNPVIGDRSFGAQPDEAAKFGVRAMEGIRTQRIIPVVKHFPGHGDTAVDSHLELPVVDKGIDELRKLELIPFRQAIASGAEMVMIAHILLPELGDDYPASMSTRVITDLLRGELGYAGVVITDDMTMKAVTNHYGAGEAAVRSFQAGSDLLLVAHDYEQITAAIDALRGAVGQGDIAEARIDASLRRIVALKQAYALSDERKEPPDLGVLNRALKERLR